VEVILLFFINLRLVYEFDGVHVAFEVRVFEGLAEGTIIQIELTYPGRRLNCCMMVLYKLWYIILTIAPVLVLVLQLF